MARVLLVDDSKIISKMLSDFLTSNGHEIVGIGMDGLQAVSLFTEHKPDLVFLDITMPNMDGKEALAEILKVDGSARVIFLTAIDDAGTSEQCLQLGAKDFLNKPLKLKNEEYCESLRQSISKALES